MVRYFKEIINAVSYDADREFYAKIFPDSVEKKDILRIRRMSKDDIPAVVEIEKQVYNYPWTEGIFKDCFIAGYKCWVCEDMENVVAYGILSVAAGEAHIMNICVDPAEQKQGIGRSMVEKMVEAARDRKINSIFLEVRPSNTAAIALYNGLGFNELGTRKDYYPAEEGREDALMLGMELIS